MKTSYYTSIAKRYPPGREESWNYICWSVVVWQSNLMLCIPSINYKVQENITLNYAKQSMIYAWFKPKSITGNLIRAPRRHVKLAIFNSFYVLIDKVRIDIEAIMPRLMVKTRLLTYLDETENMFIYCFSLTRSENQNIDAIVWHKVMYIICFLSNLETCSWISII